MAGRKSRRRPRKADAPRQIGIAWYDPVQWAKLKQVATDADQLDDTHEEWQRNAERLERELSAGGLAIRRVAIDVDALVEWCRGQNKPVDGAARAEYTTLIIRGERSS